MSNVRELTRPTEPEAPKLTGLDLLRAPFPSRQVSKLPKETRAQIDERKGGKNAIRCTICEGYHHKNAVHLDYVGHAALTDRLLDADPMWSWEPVALRDGLPAFDQTGGLWIKLTVCGVTRLGYGHAASKPNMDPGAREKEVIGDALRNAAMRYGAALDLWHKGDLHAEPEDEPKGPGAEELAVRTLCDCTDAKEFSDLWKKNFEGWKAVMPPEAYDRVRKAKAEMVDKFLRKAEAQRKAEEEAKAKAEPSAADLIGDDEIPF